MLQIRFLVLALLGFIAALFLDTSTPAVFLNRILSGNLCNSFDLNSTLCTANLTQSSDLVIAANLPVEEMHASSALVKTPIHSGNTLLANSTSLLAFVDLPPNVSSSEVDRAARNAGFPNSQFPYYEPVNGCTGVADTWDFIFSSGEVNVTEPCNNHDRCYMTLGADRDRCDRQFYNELINTCDRHPNIEQFRQRCYWKADNYFKGVQKVGSRFFSESQPKQRQYEEWIVEWLRTRNQPTQHSGQRKEAKSYGDPHLITFDGFKYSFQTVGEFTLVKSLARNFEVQVRQAPVNTSLSLNSAVAIKVGNSRVAFYSKDFPDADTNIPLRINGTPTVVENGKLSLPDNTTISKDGENNYLVKCPTGEQVTVRIYQRGRYSYMDISVAVFDSQSGQIAGLLGNFNGRGDDDLASRDGKVLPSGSTYGNINNLLNNFLPVRLPLDEIENLYFEQLYQNFGNSWRISQEESLFDYPPGKNTESFTDKGFPETYLTLKSLLPQQIQAAKVVCLREGVDETQIDGCVFDVAMTGDRGFAQTTAKIFKYLNIIDKVVPGGVLNRVRNALPAPIRQLWPF